MPTNERIERAAEAAKSARVATPWADIPEWSRDHWRQIACAALLDAAPTPEEHEHGIKAAIDAWNNAYEAQIKVGELYAGDNKPVAMRAAVAAYLAAVGLAP